LINIFFFINISYSFDLIWFDWFIVFWCHFQQYFS
jgi:hypothetical protein